MNATLAKAIVLMIPACILLMGASTIFFRHKAGSAFLRLVGASSLVVVGLTHVCEALNLVPWMRWG
jgi:hypothetical protein